MICEWAQAEMSSINLGDERLNKRAVIMLSELGSKPTQSIPVASGGRAEMQASYRFFDNEKATFEKVLEPHIAMTRRRIAEHDTVLLVEDTSEIELTRPQQQMKGLGILTGKRRGFLLHELHAFTPQGLPLGTLGAQVINREQAPVKRSKTDKQQERKHTPIEEKESYRWVQFLQVSRAAAASSPSTRCICLADSEADIYEMFAEPRATSPQDQPVHFVVRACQNRAVQEQCLHVRELVLQNPVLYEAQLHVRARRAKTSLPSQPRRKKARGERVASVQVRAATVTLRPPWRADRQLEPVTVNVVLVREANPPRGEEAVEWLLFTTLPIDTSEQVKEVVQFYCGRWNIEIFFRTLKSGCQIEHRRFEEIDRVLPCLAMYMIVAWRTLFVCRMGKECPDMDCEAIFEASEWKSVWMAVKRKKPPRHPPQLKEIVTLVACLGGYIQRPKSPPGPKAMWIGLQRMYDLAMAWDAFGPEAGGNA